MQRDLTTESNRQDVRLSRGGNTPVYISIIHTLAEERVRELMETARARFSPIEIFLSDLSPVIGAHVGPGVLAIAYMAGVEEIIAASGLLAIRKENQAQIATTGEPTYA